MAWWPTIGERGQASINKLSSPCLKCTLFLGEKWGVITYLDCQIYHDIYIVKLYICHDKFDNFDKNVSKTGSCKT